MTSASCRRATALPPGRTTSRVTVFERSTTAGPLPQYGGERREQRVRPKACDGHGDAVLGRNKLPFLRPHHGRHVPGRNDALRSRACRSRATSLQPARSGGPRAARRDCRARPASAWRRRAPSSSRSRPRRTRPVSRGLPARAQRQLQAMQRAGCRRRPRAPPPVTGARAAARSPARAACRRMPPGSRPRARLSASLRRHPPPGKCTPGSRARESVRSIRAGRRAGPPSRWPARVRRRRS